MAATRSLPLSGAVRRCSRRPSCGRSGMALVPILEMAKMHIAMNGSVHRGVLLNGMAIVDLQGNRSVIGATGRRSRSRILSNSARRLTGSRTGRDASRRAAEAVPAACLRRDEGRSGRPLRQQPAGHPAGDVMQSAYPALIYLLTRDAAVAAIVSIGSTLSSAIRSRRSRTSSSSRP